MSAATAYQKRPDLLHSGKLILDALSKAHAMQLNERKLNSLNSRKAMLRAAGLANFEKRLVERKVATVKNNDEMICECGDNLSHDKDHPNGLVKYHHSHNKNGCAKLLNVAQIACDFCEQWKHVICYGFHNLNDKRIPEVFACYSCLLLNDEIKLFDELKRLIIQRRALNLVYSTGPPKSEILFRQSLSMSE
jgi:hypothetical protein